MKNLILIALLLLPHNLFATEFYIESELGGAFFTEKESMEEAGENLEPHLKNSVFYKVGGGVLFDNNIDFGIFYNRLKSHSNNPAPDFFTNSKVKNESFDIELGYNFKAGKTKIRIMGGIRNAKYNQTTLENYTVENTGNGNHFQYKEYDSKYIRKMEGLGHRMGVSFIMPIGNSNFSIIGETNWANLFMQKDSINMVETNVFTLRSLLSAGMPHSEPHEHIHDLLSHQEFTTSCLQCEKVVYNFDLEIGIQHESKITENLIFQVAFGYRYDAQYNVRDKIYTSSKYTVNRLDEDIINHGIFARSTLRF